MQTYVAVQLDIGGCVVRHEETAQVMNRLVGEFANFDDAVGAACVQLDCKQQMNGVLVKGNHTGGHMIVTTQELEAL
ncbi:hypothetical protein [Vibrio sp. AND4]|uniref:hypothetical protein n=1 Tax=Vibrio sp. AND4 TaxID=314289 RepID=UPI00015EFEAD|nr:hypothetical protein [Vibrio sp. AND4]EDP59462.1 hypothetical bacteriophage protein [Vibrio sp. AND4]